jgi:hypothetical protein
VVLSAELGHNCVLIIALIISLIYNEEKKIDLTEVACEDMKGADWLYGKPFKCQCNKVACISNCLQMLRQYLILVVSTYLAKGGES